MEDLTTGRTKTLQFAGLVLFLTGLFSTGFLGRFTTLTSILCILGIAVGFLAYLPKLSRNGMLHLNTILYSVFFICSLAVFFQILMRHPASYDATRKQIFSISPLTKNFLQRLNEPVRVTAFLSDSDRKAASLLLNEYAACSQQFSFEVKNPVRDLADSRRFGLTILPGDIFIEKLTSDTQSVSRNVKVTKLAEEELTNGIVQLLRGKDLVLYFLTGHGELALEKNNAEAMLAGRRVTQDNLSWLVGQLKRSQVQVLPLELTQRGRVPADASAVVCVAPATDLSKSELEALRSYLGAGGRGLFLLNPDVPSVGGRTRTTLSKFTELLEGYGINLPPEIVVLPMQQKTADIYAIPAVFKDSPITHMDVPKDRPLMFTQARPVVPSSAVPEGALVDPFISSPPESYKLPIEDFAKALVTGQKINLNFNVKDLAPQNLAVAVTVQPPGTSDERASRLVVIGNGDFVATESIDQLGWMLFQNAVNWLSDNGSLIAIPSPEVENTPITLSDGQKQFLFLLLVIIVPTLIGLSGLAYSISKREQQ